jgi:hypothetical protein
LRRYTDVWRQKTWLPLASDIIDNYAGGRLGVADMGPS